MPSRGARLSMGGSLQRCRSPPPPPPIIGEPLAQASGQSDLVALQACGSGSSVPLMAVWVCVADASVTSALVLAIAGVPAATSTAECGPIATRFIPTPFSPDGRHAVVLLFSIILRPFVVPTNLLLKLSLPFASARRGSCALDVARTRTVACG
jgi:hypothetical protein